MNFWSPGMDPRHPMGGTRPERYALRIEEGGSYLAVDGPSGGIREVSGPERAYQFTTHQGALRVARDLASLGCSRVNVVKVL